MSARMDPINQFRQSWPSEMGSLLERSKIRLRLHTTLNGEPTFLIDAPCQATVHRLKMLLEIHRRVDTSNQVLAVWDGKDYVPMEDSRRLGSFGLADGHRVFFMPVVRTGPQKGVLRKKALMCLTEETRDELLAMMDEHMKNDGYTGEGCYALVRRQPIEIRDDPFENGMGELAAGDNQYRYESDTMKDVDENAWGSKPTEIMMEGSENAMESKSVSITDENPVTAASVDWDQWESKRDALLDENEWAWKPVTMRNEDNWLLEAVAMFDQDAWPILIDQHYWEPTEPATRKEEEEEERMEWRPEGSLAEMWRNVNTKTKMEMIKRQIRLRNQERHRMTSPPPASTVIHCDHCGNKALSSACLACAGCDGHFCAQHIVRNRHSCKSAGQRSVMSNDDSQSSFQCQRSHCQCWKHKALPNSPDQQRQMIQRDCCLQ